MRTGPVVLDVVAMLLLAVTGARDAAAPAVAPSDPAVLQQTARPDEQPNSTATCWVDTGMSWGGVGEFELRVFEAPGQFPREIIDEPPVVALPTEVPPPPPAPARRIGVTALVGDSITDMNRDQIVRELNECSAPPVAIRASSGRIVTTDQTLFGEIQSGWDAIEELEREADPDRWIIQLGVNDVNSDPDGFDPDRIVSGVLERIDETDEVWWVDIWSCANPAASQRFNEVLSQYERVQVIPWSLDAPDHTPDGLHPDPLGVSILTDHYCSVLSDR